MKVSVLALLCCALLAVPHSVKAEDSKVFKLDTSVAFVSDYMWRGKQLYDGTAIQPSVTGTVDLQDDGAFVASVWNHTSGETDRKSESFNEVDYTVSYRRAVGPVTATAGHIWYTYSHDNVGNLDTAEFFVALAFDAPLAPTLSYFRDYDSFDANYYELTFSHAIETDSMGEGFNMTPYVTFGFGDEKDKAYADTGLGFVQIGATFTLNLGDVSVVPGIHYTLESDKTAKNELWFGVNFGYSL